MLLHCFYYTLFIHYGGGMSFQHFVAAYLKLPRNAADLWRGIDNGGTIVLSPKLGARQFSLVYRYSGFWDLITPNNKVPRISGTLGIQKYDLLFNGKLSLPKAIEKLENEVSLLTSSDMKTVNDKKSSKMIALNDKQIRAMRNGIKRDVKNFVYHLISEMYMKLVSQAKYFKSELQYGKDISKIIYSTQRNYSTKFHKYSEELINDVDPLYDLDKHFIILDLIENSNRLLLDECTGILNVMHKQSTNNMNPFKMNYLLEALHKFLVVLKKEELEYACAHYKVCRNCPAYSDYISDLIKELLELPDDKLSYLIMNLKLLFNEKSHIIKVILTDNLFSKLTVELRLIFNEDKVKVRKALAKLREILTEKHKLTRSKDDIVIRKSRSITMLIDMIDKAFDRSDAEVLSIYFDNTFQTLRRWDERESQHITSVLGSFIRYFADSIKYNWKPEAYEEVKVLIEIILTGNATNENVNDYLFTKGSTYLNSKPETDLNLSL